MIAVTSDRKRTVARTWTATILIIVLASDLVSAADPLYKSNSGQNSAYTPVAEYKKYSEHCAMKQVHLLQTPGARQPAPNPSASIQATLAKVINKTHYARSEMAFLANYTYNLGDEGSLIPFGASQLYDAGSTIGKRYCSGPLGKVFCGTPFLRSSSSTRLRESAGNWSEGFLSSQYTKSPIQASVIVSETSDSRNTLSNCPNLVSIVLDAQDEWRAVWTPAVVQRLQSEESYGLNSKDVLNFAYLCAFDSYAINATSPFCGLLKSFEWAYIEYDGDLDKYYGNAYPGAPLSRSQGTSYVNELSARLTSDRSYVDKDTTQVNHTLDSDSKTFPLDKKFYADVGYNNLMLAVFGILGFFQDDPLSTTLPCPMRSFVSSKMVPFAGRMVVESLDCSGAFEGGYWGKIFKGRTDFVRVMVNDQAMDLTSLCGQSKVTDRGTYCTR
ncbi:hypothetical protein MVLG_02471 [Microbotryum lychnidis-dioicae p1A1 Lamole]|uniref:Phytase A n=1 Tax=Microbotryum lychnidis-dioicae (strain p1A1 Lamole / MvSl-1064) TaxID=683840 RepID=U5H596_USTV1|nr:hypothetical protein MVLG_02471 [Microbotryum lychnidis-dioicae p1A1 Lamole]|eukprot:KDE07251.1 hypothetical protein MVLG_02471 [Microbotryum lychnidis-dioicae p1A1 Lamole]